MKKYNTTLFKPTTDPKLFFNKEGIRKRCARCKKKAYWIIRLRNLESGEILEEYTFLCKRHYDKQIKLISKQSNTVKVEK